MLVFIMDKLINNDFILYVKVINDLKCLSTKLKTDRECEKVRIRCHVSKCVYSREVTKTGPCPGKLKVQCSVKGATTRLYGWDGTDSFLTGSRKEETSPGFWFLNKNSIFCAWFDQPELEPSPRFWNKHPSHSLFCALVRPDFLLCTVSQSEHEGQKMFHPQTELQSGV